MTSDAEFIEVSLTSEHVPMSNGSSFIVEHVTISRPKYLVLDIGETTLVRSCRLFRTLHLALCEQIHA